MNRKEVMSKIETHVATLFASSSFQLKYHNLTHTKEVVAAANRIADHYDLEKIDKMAVLTSAWFHDVGYLFGITEGHEQKSVDEALRFLDKEGADQSLKEKVEECILATRLPQRPNSLIGKIMCDADLYHFGTENFYEINKRVRKEAEQLSGKKISSVEWFNGAIKLLRMHEFQTDYCQKILKKEKDNNIVRLQEKLAEKIKEEKDKKETKGISEKTGEKGNKEFKAGRGIETMFRTTSTNHLKLSEMADSKANILLTINSLMVSILVSVLFRHLDTSSEYIVPAVLFLLTSLATVVCAILVTLPHVTAGLFTKEDIRNKDANLLFFGNFYKMKLEDYQWGINELMKDPEFLYDTMSKDIYHLGVVLGRKYKLLRIAYSIFMIGFVLSILSFFVVGYFQLRQEAK